MVTRTGVGEDETSVPFEEDSVEIVDSLHGSGSLRIFEHPSTVLTHDLPRPGGLGVRGLDRAKRATTEPAFWSGLGRGQWVATPLDDQGDEQDDDDSREHDVGAGLKRRNHQEAHHTGRDNSFDEDRAADSFHDP